MYKIYPASPSAPFEPTHDGTVLPIPETVVCVTEEAIGIGRSAAF